MRVTRRGVLVAGAVTAGCLGRPNTPPAACAGTGGSGRIGFVGDVMLGRSVTDRWEGADPTGVWGSTLGRLRALDGLVANLECCVSHRGERWPDKTFYFRADPTFAVPALESAGVSAATLANNHALDFGAVALGDTRSHLSTAGVQPTGAGRDRDRALDPAVFEAGDLTVAVIGLTDQLPAYAAGKYSPGTAFARLDRTNPRTEATVTEVLSRARAHEPDLVVASLHWGPNWETSPDGTQELFARYLIEEGVDVVHGHSAHVLQGVERYRGRPIIYDAGDFVDDYIDKEGYHNKLSALFELRVAGGVPERLEAIPVEIADESVSVATGPARARVEEILRARSSAFGTETAGTGTGLAIDLDGC